MGTQRTRIEHLEATITALEAATKNPLAGLSDEELYRRGRVLAARLRDIAGDDLTGAERVVLARVAQIDERVDEFLDEADLRTCAATRAAEAEARTLASDA